MDKISIYTDGSCDPSYRIGAWVSIILSGNEKKILKGHFHDTTHQRMELTAVIHALEYMQKSGLTSQVITLYTDSQYVVGLPNRKDKLKASNFTTKKKDTLQNADLIARFFTLVDNHPIILVKVKSHQKNSYDEQLNGEADRLCRKIMREIIADSGIRRSETGSPIRPL